MAYQRLTGTDTTGTYRSLVGLGAAPVPVDQEARSRAITSIPGNLMADLQDIGRGVTSLVSSGVHDIGRGLAQVIPGTQEWGVLSDNPQGTYQLPGILAELPGAVAKDYATRYGPLLPGGEAPTETAGEFAEHPLSFILDALAVGAIAGKAAQGAGLAGKAGEALGISGPKIVSEAGPGAVAQAEAKAAELVTAGVRGSTAQAAATRSVLEDLAAAGKLSSGGEIARRLLPQPALRFGTEGAVASAEFQNPVLRAMAAPVRRAMTEPLRDFEIRAGIAKGEVRNTLPLGEPLGVETGEAKYLQDIAEQARGAGLSRIERPWAMSFNTKVRAMQMHAELGADWILHRQQAAKPYVDALEPHITADPNVVRLYHGRASGVDVNFPDLNREEWATKYPTLREAQVSSLIPVGGGGAPTLTRARLAETADLSPVEVESFAGNLDDPIYVRTQAATAALDDYITRVREVGDTYSPEVDFEIEMAQRLKRQLNDGLRRRFDPGFDPDADETDLAVDAERLVDVEQFAEAFRELRYAPSQVMSRAYRDLQLIHGGRFDGDQMVGAPEISDLDDALAEAHHVAPTYYPYMDAERTRNSVWFRANTERGARLLAKDPHAKRYEGVLLKEGTFLNDDPVRVMAMRSSQAVREIETFRQVDEVLKRFGREITSAEDLPPGWMPYSPDAMFIQHRTRLEMMDSIARSRQAGMSVEEAVWKAMMDRGFRAQDEVMATLEGGAKLYAIPETVVKQMHRASDLARVVGGTGVRGYWDSTMNIWRALVLTGSPRWIINNLFGNTAFALMQGTKFADVSRILTERLRMRLAKWAETKGVGGERLAQLLGGTELREGTLAAEMLKLPGATHIGSGYVASEAYVPKMGRAAGTLPGRMQARWQTSRTGRLARSWSEAVRTLNMELESSFREASYLTAIEKMQGKTAITRTGRSFWGAKQRMERIMADGFTEAKGRAALTEVNHFFGDYSRMTPFERHVIRRFISPFWGFYRHQLKLIVTFPFESPIRAQVLRGLAQVHSDMLDAYGPLPEWLEGAVPLGPPGPQVEFMTTRGANPFQTTFEPPTGALSPALQVFLEQSLGRNLYTGKPFTSADVIENFGGMRFRLDENGVPQPLGENDVAPGIIEHLLQQVPQYDMAKTILGGGKTYDTATLADILRGEGVMTTPEGEVKYPTTEGQQLSKLLGFPTLDFDVAAYQNYLREQQAIALKAFMSRQAVAP